MINLNDVCSAGIKDFFLKKSPDEINYSVNPEEVKYCREYIKEFLKESRRGHSSYHFKHSVERHYNNYITNGALLRLQF